VFQMVEEFKHFSGLYMIDIIYIFFVVCVFFTMIYIYIYK